MERPMTKAETFAEAERIQGALLNERARRDREKPKLTCSVCGEVGHVFCNREQR
jgi:hypothetical protein